MSRITGIESSSRRPNRVVVRLSSGRPLTLWAAAASDLRVGQDLTPADLERLRRADATEEAYQRALRFLSFRTRSETEIRQYLKKRGVDLETTARVVDRLRRSELADDSQFVRTWVENRTTFRPRSRRALAWELHHKGVSAREIETALADLDDASMALQAGLQYAHRLRGEPWPDFRRKLHAYLARRGFSSTVIGTAVSSAWSATTAGHPILENEEVL
jgi:regulatory protein